MEHFRASVRERTQKIRAALAIVSDLPEDSSAREELTRELHTLKGEAELMAFKEVALIVRHSEALVAATKGRAPEPHTLEALEYALTAVTAIVSGAGEVDVEQSVARLESARIQQS